jgi:double zinc ribbon protein
MALVDCKECGKKISDKAKTCPKCGVNRPVTCTDCGKEFSRKAIACPNCGCPWEDPSKHVPTPYLVLTFFSFGLPCISCGICSSFNLIFCHPYSLQSEFAMDLMKCLECGFPIPTPNFYGALGILFMTCILIGIRYYFSEWFD